MRNGVVAIALTLALPAAPAAADPQLTPITDRNYAIDFYDGVPLGNSAVLATGGATAANAAGSSGSLVNASAPAVRATTDTDSWSWDYHLDYLIGSLSSDYANTGIDYGALGIAQPDTATQTFTLGLSLRVHDWGGAITASFRHTLLSDAVAMLPSGGSADVYATTYRIKFALARWFPGIDTAIGLAANSAIFDVKPDCAIAGCDTLFSMSGGGGEVGAQWIPRFRSYRFGAALASAIVGTNVTVDQCADPGSCDGFILPQEVVSAARLTVGAAYRFAETEWNQAVGGTFRDEPSVTVLADLVVTGPSPNAYGLDAFGINMLERSGRHNSISPRGGVEYEWLPGRLRVRGGSYWEPGRFEGVGGRIHATFGIEVRALEFQAWGRRRGRITLTGDLAPGYRNLGISVGFWH
jgi:hypothetical protein